jgi:hypothetical protein
MIGAAVGCIRVVTDRWQVFSDFVLTAESLAELAESADELLVGGRAFCASCACCAFCG